MQLILWNGVQTSLGKGARKRCLPMQNGAVVKSWGEGATYAARLNQRHGWGTEPVADDFLRESLVNESSALAPGSL